MGLFSSQHPSHLLTYHLILSTMEVSLIKNSCRFLRIFSMSEVLVGLIFTYYFALWLLENQPCISSQFFVVFVIHSLRISHNLCRNVNSAVDTKRSSISLFNYTSLTKIEFIVYTLIFIFPQNFCKKFASFFFVHYYFEKVFHIDAT